jgi:hypothetical protein
MRGLRAAETGLRSPFGKGAITVIAPEHIVRAVLLAGRAGYQQVEVAVVVVVHKGERGGLIARGEACGLRHIGKLVLAKIFVERNVIREGDGKIVQSVVVVIADGAGNGRATGA